MDALRRPRVWGPAFLAALLLASGAVAASVPSAGGGAAAPQAAPAGAVSLADGVEVAKLPDAPAAQDEPAAARVDGRVVAELAKGDPVAVVVRLREQADLGAVAAEARSRGRAQGRGARVATVVERLRVAAEHSQGRVAGLLGAEEAAGRARDVRAFWIFNGFAATITQETLDRLAEHPDVESVTLDAVLTAPEVESAPRLPTWGLEKVNAPKTWGDYGFTGKGVVVGVMDTGVDGGHPALSSRYRGRDGDHASSWYVPTGENYATPGDGHGHGTHVTGSIVGGPPGEVIGVAPDAEWIAAKIFRDSGTTTTSIIHAAFEWMLAPGGDPAKAPHVVNNSWGSTATLSTEFLPDVRAWVAAGIFPAFANGNAGPGAGTVGSPASFPESFGVGATDVNDFVASFSSRGPVTWDGVTYVKPQVSAPGHQIFSAWPRQLGRDYHTISGTSMATPHLSGVVALILSAQPGLSVDALRDLLTSTARREPHMGRLPNNDYGHGIADAYAAVTAARFSGTLVGTVTGPDGPVAGARVEVEALGASAETDAAGAYELRLREGEWPVRVSAYGYVAQTAQVTIEAGEEEARDFALAAAATHTLSGVVTSEGAPLAGARVRVSGTPLDTAYTGADGTFSLEVAAGSYEVVAEATGFRRETREVELDGDLELSFALDRLPGAVSPEWREYQNNRARTGLSAEELSAGALTRAWSVRNSGQIMFGSPTVAGGRVYVAHTTGLLRALDLDDGSLLWTFGTGANFRGAPAVAEGRVFLGGGDSGVFHALNAATGAPLWSYDTGGQRLTYTTPTVSDGTVYFGTGWGTGNGGWVHALDATTGALRWKTFVGGQIYFAPAVGGGRVYAASYDAQRLVALDAASGEELWAHTRTADSFAAMPSYDDGRLYVATNDFGTGVGSVLALDAETGEKQWEATGHGDGAGNAPAVFGDLVIAGSNVNNWVVAYDRGTGARRWVYSAGAAVSNSQLVADGVLVGGSQQDRRVWALDASTGELLWEDAMTDNVLSAPALADGRLVVADRSGTVRAYEAPGVVEGTVTDTAGAPLAAEVRVPATGASAGTDPATGAFELSHRPGELVVEAVAYGYVSASAEVRVRSGQRLTRSFVLAPAEAGSLRGTVRDEAGAPLAGVEVGLEGTTLDPQSTGGDGAFAFPVVAEGTYTLVASLPGWVTLRQDVTIAAGEETTAELTLLRYQIAVTGDRDGAITQYLRGKGYRVESTTAAAIAGHPGAYALVVANGSQDDPGEETFLDLVANADAAETSVIFLDTWGLSYGALWHLIKYAGDPSTRASGFNDGEVSLIARAEHPLTEGLELGTRVPVLTANKEWASFGGYSGRSLADVFVGRTGGTTGTGIGFQPRTLGSVHVLLSLHAASPWTGPFTGWTPAGARVFDNAVGYALGASFGAVEGTVTAAEGGTPLAATVTAVESGDRVTAGADGGYRLLLPPGEHTLRFERIGYVAEERAVTVVARETQTVDAALASSGAGGVTGLVTSAADGTPLAGARAALLGTELEATTGGDGRFAIDGVPGGTYDLEVSAAGFRSEVVEVVVEDGAATDVDVALRPALRVAVIGDFLTGGENKLTKFLQEHEIDAVATQWEAIAGLDAYDLVIANNPSDPGAAAFRAHLDALDAAGKSAIFLDGGLSTQGGVRLLRTHVGNPLVKTQVGSTVAGDRFVRPLAGTHPLFRDVPLQPNGNVHVLASGRAAGYFDGYTGVHLGRFGVGTNELGLGAAYEPRTPTSVRLLLAALAATSSAHPELGWTDGGKQLLLNAIEWAASPGLGTVAGRVVDAGGEPVATASVRIVETGAGTDVDADGSFLVPHAPGEWTLEVGAYGYATRQVPVTIEAGRTTQLEVELAIGDVGTVAGVVTGRGSISGASEEGLPLEGAEVALLGVPRAATTAADGSYAIPHVEPGEYTLQVDAAGHVRQRFQVTVAAGETARQDAVLRPSPRVVVVDDCQQTANCVDKLRLYLEEWGYQAEEIDWTDLDRVAEADLVVANLGDFPRLDPTEAGLAAFQDAANRAHVPVLWLEQFQRGSIRWLSEYEGDPVSVGEARSQGLVEAVIREAHPLVEGFEVGERVPVIDGGSFEHTWFNGFSGTTVADLATATAGVKGSMIAYRGRTASSAEVLFSSMAASFYTWPPVGAAPAQLLTPQALRLFHNALNWALDAPPLAGEARGTVRSSAGGVIESTVEVLETGRTYPGRAGDGAFLVPLQPGDWTLEVRAFGHDPQQLPVSVAAGTVRTLSVTLQAQDVGSVAGTVTGPDGAPVDGVSLSLVGTPLTGTTDASGGYRIDHVPVGAHTLLVRRSGFGHQRLPLTVASGATTRVDVQLAPSKRIAVAGDQANRLSAWLTENGYATEAWSWTNVHQHAGDLDDVDLVILNGVGTQPTAANLRTFVDAAAEANRSLVFAGQNGNGSIRTLRTTYDDPSAWTQGFVPNAIYYRPSEEHPIFAGFPVGQPIELVVNSPNQQYEQFGGYSGETIATVESATAPLGGGVAYKFVTPTSVHLLLGSLGVTTTFGGPDVRWTDNARQIYLNAVEWALGATQSELFGTVASDGEPVADARVEAVEAGASTRTAGDGSYRLGLADGTHTVRVTALGYEPFETSVEVGVDERVRLDVELVAVPRGAIEGTVTSAATGAPLAGAEVSLEGPQEAGTTTDAAGAFAFADLLPGDYELELRAEGHLPARRSVTVAAGETAVVEVALRANDVAVLGDHEGVLVDFLRAHGHAAEELPWPVAATRAEAYDVVVVNGGSPGAEAFEALVSAADEAGTSLVFTGTWGVLNGGLRLLAQHRPHEVAIGGHGYGHGEVTLASLAGGHPLFAGLEPTFRPVARDGYYSFLDRYVGPYLATLAVEGQEEGVGAAYDFRSATSVHVLLPTAAATGLIGPGYGWTAAGEELLLNAVDWAREAEQEAPEAPTLAAEAELVAASPAELTGTAEFRSTVTVFRGTEELAQAEPERDGTFAVEVPLVEGPNELTAVAANHAGSSAPSAAVTVVLDTTAPALSWTPADRTGFFEPDIVVAGTATDAHAGVAEVLVNGSPASLAPDGSFTAGVTLAPGVNELTVTARDAAGNAVTETRQVAHFPYSTRWTVAGAQGQGELTVFLDITDPAGAAVQATAVRAELVRGDGGVEASAEMTYADGRYRANLGRPPAGTYALRGIVTLGDYTVRAPGPVVVRTPRPVPPR